MAALSNYLENKLIDHIFRDIAFTMPSTIYIALLTTNAVASDTGTTLTSGVGGTGVEVNGSAYARQPYNPSASSNWTATQGGTVGASNGTTGSTSNSSLISFPAAGTAWGLVVGIAICDAATNGNMLFFGALPASKQIDAGDMFEFGVGNLKVQMS